MRIKIAKTIPIPGEMKIVKRKHTIGDLPIALMKVGESVRVEKVSLETRNAEVKIKDYETKIYSLLYAAGLGHIKVHIALRKTPKRAEIRLWRTK
jgi:hypothetical protein